MTCGSFIKAWIVSGWVSNTFRNVVTPIDFAADAITLHDVRKVSLSESDIFHRSAN